MLLVAQTLLDKTLLQSVVVTSLEKLMSVIPSIIMFFFVFGIVDKIPENRVVSEK